MQTILQTVWKLALVLCLLGTADFATAATREFSGSVYQAGTDFGGSPYCNYHVELSSISHAISLSSDLTSVLGSSLSGTHTETGLNGCTAVSPPPTTFQYTMTSSAISGNNVSIQYVSVANPDFPQGIASFSGTIGLTCGIVSCFDSISGTLTFTRTDQGPPLNWTVSSYAFLSEVTPRYSLTINLTGTGFGSVSSNPGSISCYNYTSVTMNPVCQDEFNSGTSVTLTATPTTDSVFTGWSQSSCGTMPTCTVAMNDAYTLSASFSPKTVTTLYPLTVSKAGTGSGRIISSPSGIDCGAQCIANFPSGSSVTLTAIPDTGSTFTGWSIPSCGTSTTCTVGISGDGDWVAATFDKPVYGLRVSAANGSGPGKVTANTGILSCSIAQISAGSFCYDEYPSGTTVTLTATPNAGYVFAGWSGDCSGTDNCSVTMTNAKNVSVMFTAGASLHTLTVSKSGTGSGTVTSIGINCGSDCSEGYTAGTSVTLTATPAAGSTFSGWSGDCSGTSTYCTVSMTNPRNVTAMFTAGGLSHTLTVSKAGTGGGTVTSTGINCGTDCSESYAAGTSVTLTATPASGSYFSGWSGDCSGAGTCILAMNSAKNVTATFKLAPFVATTTSNITATSAIITTTITFNSTDIGKQGSVFITGWVPKSGLSALGISTDALNETMLLTVTSDNPYLGGEINSRQVSYDTLLSTTGTISFVLIQKIPSGWALVVNGQLIPYITNTMGEFSSSITILNTNYPSALDGAQFCVGYGANDIDMITSGKMQPVAIISASSSTTTSNGSCNVTDVVVEFYNQDLKHYFITADANEAATIDSGKAGPGWTRTGNSFRSGGSTPVCRFYGSQSPGPNSHFYTLQGDECDGLKQLQASTPATQKRWNFESLDFISTPPVNGACPGGTVSVYRAYNNGYSQGIDSNHRITSNSSAIQEVVSQGWSDEGVIMCAPL